MIWLFYDRNIAVVTNYFYLHNTFIYPKMEIINFVYGSMYFPLNITIKMIENIKINFERLVIETLYGFNWIKFLIRKYVKIM